MSADRDRSPDREPRPRSSPSFLGEGAGEGVGSGGIETGARRRIGRYVVLHKLGSGGMSSVYSAFDEELDRRVAIKLLNPRREGDPAQIVRLWREAQALAQISHPNVLQVYEIGEHQGRTYLVMEFVRGVTFRGWLQARKRSVEEIATVLGLAGRGLAVAHAAGIVHRDVKPENILVHQTPDGVLQRVVMADFGLARIGDGEVERTPATTDSEEAVVPLGTTPSRSPRDSPSISSDDESTRSGAYPSIGADVDLDASVPAGVDASLIAAPAMNQLGSERAARQGTIMAPAAHERVISSEPDDDAEQEHGGYPRSLAFPLTRADTVIGTPAYMAPEQQRKEDVTAKSDQFAFCICLLEAIYGRHPCAAPSVKQMRQRIARVDFDPPPAGIVVPPALRRVLDRGLARDPSLRFDDMPHLLGAITSALRPAPRLASYRVLAATVICGAALAALVLTLATLLPRGATAGQCDELLGAKTREWTVSDTASLEARLALVNAAAAPGLSRRAAEAIQARIEELVRVSAPVCETLALGGVAATTASARLTCLEELANELDATLVLLRGEDQVGVEQAIAVVDGIRSPVHCSQAEVASAPVESDRAGKLRSRARVLLRAAQYDEACDLATEAVAQGQVVGGSSYSASLLLLAQCELARGQADTALALGRDALVQADRVSDDVGRVRAAALLVSVTGSALADTPQAEIWLSQARSALYRAGSPQLLSAELHATVGTLRLAQTRSDAAQSEFRAALDAYAGRFPDSAPEVMTARNGLAIALYNDGDNVAAEALYRDSLTVLRRDLGAEHPMVATALSNLGIVLASQGQEVAALAVQEEALAIRVKTLGEHHPHTGYTRNSIGSRLERLGRYDEAQVQLQAALVSLEIALPANHPDLALPISNLGQLALSRGDLELAAVQLEDALTRTQKAYGDDHPELAYDLSKLASVARRRGNLKRAIDLDSRALQIRERALGEEHPLLLESLVPLAEMAVERGMTDEAVAYYVRADAIASSHSGDPIVHAALLRALADLLAAQDAPRSSELRDRAAKLGTARAADFDGASHSPR